jgi:transcriptional antiterminator NusG
MAKKKKVDLPKKQKKDTANTADAAIEEPKADENTSLIVLNEDTPKRAKWYVVHTYSGHEKKVANLVEALTLGHELTNKIFKILIPTQQKIVVSEGKKRKVNERLFPGYIIVNMIMDDEAWYLIRSTKGVTGFVGTGNTPTPLPKKEVDTLMKFMTMEAPKFETKFKIGDSVKINEGPFQDFLGKVDEVNEDQGKVRVLVSVFGRETPVELDFVQITSI